MRLASLLAGFALMLAGVAQAQSTGTNIRQPSDRKYQLDNQVENRVLLAADEAAACVADRSPSRLHDMFAEPFGSRPQYRDLKRILTLVDCEGFSGYRARIDSLTLLSALVENLAEQGLGVDRDERVFSTDLSDVPGENIILRSSNERLGACVALTDATAVLRYLATDPGSEGEMEQLRAIAPTLGSCISEGTQVEANPASVRTTLAIGLYRVERARFAGGGEGSSE